MNNNSISSATTPKIKANRLTNPKTLRFARRWTRTMLIAYGASQPNEKLAHTHKKCFASREDKCIAFNNEDKKYDTAVVLSALN